MANLVEILSLVDEGSDFQIPKSRHSSRFVSLEQGYPHVRRQASRLQFAFGCHVVNLVLNFKFFCFFDKLI